MCRGDFYDCFAHPPYNEFEWRRLTQEQLWDIFCPACEKNYGERLADLYDTELADLTDAFQKLPHLEALDLNARLKDHKPSEDAQDISNLTNVVDSAHDFIQPKQLTALITAAFRAEKRIRSFRILGPPKGCIWKSETLIDMIVPVLQESYHFTLDVGPQSKPGGFGFSACLTLAINAPKLVTLRLTKRGYRGVGMRHTSPLSRTRFKGVHWARLQCLQLEGIHSTQAILQDLLKDHQGTLCVLKLGEIFLRPYQGPPDLGYDDNIISLIHFMQDTMKLRSFNFAGILIAYRGDYWIIDKGGMHGTYHSSMPPHIRCLKHRVERFVIEGGECPLRFENGRYRADSWPEGDDSWKALTSEQVPEKMDWRKYTWRVLDL